MNECIAKGQARTPSEFDVKVSVAVTDSEDLVVGMRSMPGNPSGGHTLDSQLNQVGILTGHTTPRIVLAERGYRSAPPSGTRQHSRCRCPPSANRVRSALKFTSLDDDTNR